MTHVGPLHYYLLQPTTHFHVGPPPSTQQTHVGPGLSVCPASLPCQRQHDEHDYNNDDHVHDEDDVVDDEDVVDGIDHGDNGPSGASPVYLAVGVPCRWMCDENDALTRLAPDEIG